MVNIKEYSLTKIKHWFAKMCEYTCPLAQRHVLVHSQCARIPLNDCILPPWMHEWRVVRKQDDSPLSKILEIRHRG